MTAAPTITVKALRVPLHFAQTRGVSSAQILGPIGVDPSLLDDPDGQVPLAWLDHVWTEASRMTGDAAFGIHAAEFLAQRPGHVIDYLAAYGRTARALFELIQRYQRTLGSQVELELVIDGPIAKFGNIAGNPNVQKPSQFVEFVSAQWVLRWRERCAEPLEFRRVCFMHARPAEMQEHERVFGRNIEFTSKGDFIEFDAEKLDIALLGANETLLGFIRTHAETLLAKMNASGHRGIFTARSREALFRAEPGDLPGIERVARTLGLSERSLQRKLNEEGTSFKDVLDDVRREIACGYLRDPRHSISDIAFLVGFSEISAFSRAFRRWTDLAPLAWRRSNMQQSPIKSFG